MLPGLGILGTAFWLWMLYDCLQNEPDRNTWLWILIILNLPAAVLYFVVRVLPRMGVSAPRGQGLPLGRLFGRWTRRQEIWNAESAARSVGTAHHWTVYGDLLQQVGQRDQAAEAFGRALEKDPVYPNALWGAASSALEAGRYADARPPLQRLVELDPAHKYGKASLEYGRVLLQLGELDAARAHLEKHLERWSHPEAFVLLAAILKRRGEVTTARELLERMVRDVRGGPHYHYRTHKPLVRQAERLLRSWAAEGKP
jgi:hypothetical protein